MKRWFAARNFGVEFFLKILLTQSFTKIFIQTPATVNPLPGGSVPTNREIRPVTRNGP